MESDSFNDKQILLPSDTLFTLLEKQAKEFETFGKRMSLDIQNSYKTYFQQNDFIKTSELEIILGKQQDQIESQSLLIDSLRSRIEELENDSIKKNHEINKLKKEFLDFKKEIKLLLILENSPSKPLDHKKVNSLFEENDSDEFEFINSEAKYSDSNQFVESLTAATDNILRQNDIDNNIKQQQTILSNNAENIWSNERLIAENIQSNEIDINNERLIFNNNKNNNQQYNINEMLQPKDEINNGSVVENKKTSIFGSVLFDEYFYNHSTFTDNGESSVSVKSTSDLNGKDKGKSSPSVVSKGKSNDSDSKEDSTEDSSSLSENNDNNHLDDVDDEELEEDIKYNPSKCPSKNLNQKLRDLLLDLKASGTESSKESSNHITKTSSSQHKDNNIPCIPPISINPRSSSSSTSKNNNKSNLGSQKAKTAPSVVEQIQAEVQYTILRFQEQNAKIKQKTFNYLLNQFSLEGLIKYQETAYYNNLARDPKRSIKLMVKTALRSELCNKDKRITQPVEEYVKRKIIPSLPNGIKSYADYEKSSNFVKLSDEKKKRIRKIITVEPK